jgi:predicted phosphodiesterase
MSAKKEPTKKISIANKLSNIAHKPEKEAIRKEFLESLATTLKKKGIDPSDIGHIKKFSTYQTITKDENGEAEIHDLWAFQFSPAFEDGPDWPVINPGPSISLPKSTVKKTPRKGFKKAIIVPDIQIGYYRLDDGTYEPCHDERAVSIALQVISDTQPDLIVCVGDNLDFPELGKYRHSPAYAYTTQKSIDRAAVLGFELRAAAPNARIVWLAGNHEERLPNFILDNAKAAFGLRKGDTPKSWPVMSVPSLCRFDESKIEYIPGYPAGDFWINEKLRVIHGNRVKSNGSTAHIYLNQEKVSVIYGHIHRCEIAWKTRLDFDGARTIMAASPGCLARIDGAVPSTKGGIDLDGRPVPVTEDWQQGLGIVYFQDGEEHKFTYENMQIYNGWGMYQGIEYRAK